MPPVSGVVVSMIASRRNRSPVPAWDGSSTELNSFLSTRHHLVPTAKFGSVGGRTKHAVAFSDLRRTREQDFRGAKTKPAGCSSTWYLGFKVSRMACSGRGGGPALQTGSTRQRRFTATGPHSAMQFRCCAAIRMLEPCGERIPAANGTHQTSISKQILTARIGGLVSHDAVVESGPLANKRFDLLGTEKAGGRDALSRRS
jgi:hypothetical protein